MHTYFTYILDMCIGWFILIQIVDRFISAWFATYIGWFSGRFSTSSVQKIWTQIVWYQTGSVLTMKISIKEMSGNNDIEFRIEQTWISDWCCPVTYSLNSAGPKLKNTINWLKFGCTKPNCTRLVYTVHTCRIFVKESMQLNFYSCLPVIKECWFSGCYVHQESVLPLLSKNGWLAGCYINKLFFLK